MPKIKCYAISCSADVEVDIRKLYVWGGGGISAKWLPETKGEIKKRLNQCRRELKCDACDAEIHEIVIERTKKTKKQNLR